MPATEPRSSLLRKYVAIVATLTCAAVLTSGLTQFWFRYQDQKRVLTRLQQEKASAAAGSIEQFVDQIVRQVRSVASAEPRRVARAAELSERRIDYLRLIDQVPAIYRVRYVDSRGREDVRVSRFEPDVLDSGEDLSRLPVVDQARLSGTSFGAVTFLRQSQPAMTIAVRQGRRDDGVVLADVDLGFVRSAIAGARVGEAGYGYAVDSQGRLVAHPDVSLVLRRTSFTSLPQVEQALHDQDSRAAGGDVVTIGRDQAGAKVLSAHERIEPLGWTVFVDEPLSEAYASLSSLIKRTIALLVVFLALSVLTSVVLARRLVRPIEALRAAAARIGAGRLEHRIEVERDDELGSLAAEFNRMTERLRDSYTELEHRVDERTQDLARVMVEVDQRSHKVEAVSRHKSEFLASMSHELRTPLNAIIGFSEVLLEQRIGELNEKQSDYLRDVVAAARELLALINDILDLSKVEAGRIELELGPVSIGHVLEKGLTMVRERAVQHGITLGHEVDARVGEIEADERRVGQIVFNLLSNAVKFTPDGGCVDVSAYIAGDELLVAVRDTGVGIAPEDQALIFEEFTQARSVRRYPSEGTGLGLALSRRLVELHGGRLWVESVPGEGSCFTFALPARVPLSHRAQAADRDQASASPAPERT